MQVPNNIETFKFIIVDGFCKENLSIKCSVLKLYFILDYSCTYTKLFINISTQMITNCLKITTEGIFNVFTSISIISI